MRSAGSWRILCGLFVSGTFVVGTGGGCGKSDPVDGKIYHQDGAGIMTIEFKDHKAKVDMMGENKTMDYKVEGDKVTVLNRAQGDMELTHHSDGTLTGPMGTLRPSK
jgi:hypothetical protein